MVYFRWKGWSVNTQLGHMIRSRRQTVGLTLEDVAARVGVTVGALSHIESGRRLPSAPNAMLIAEVLGISAEEMLRALDDEHSIKRETAARDSVNSRQSPSSMSASLSARRLDTASRAYSPRPVEELFEPGLSGDARSSARWSQDTSERVEALDRLADSASEAIRTLRGLLADDDPVVAREARRLLRELDVRVPEE